jgi:hypothetical protein
VTNKQIFRSRSGYVYLAIVLLVGAALAIQTWLTGDFESAAAATLWSLFFVLAAHLIFVRPKLVVSDEGVTVINPLRTYEISWGAVNDIDTRFALTFVTEKRRISAWVATAPGRYHGRTIHPSELKGLGLGQREHIQPGDSPRTRSGQAAAVCRARLEQFRASH